MPFKPVPLWPPFLGVITPTIQRRSLIDLCRSIDQQTFTNWCHLVVVDCDYLDDDLLTQIRHSQRAITICERPHRNGGNSCRAAAVRRMLSPWIYFADDDNLIADGDAFQRMHDKLAALPDETQWALFPIMRLGHRFYSDPPRACHVDTMNFVLRREIAYWPETDAYGTDGILVDDLMMRGVPYAAFPETLPIGVIPKISFCQ
ncbi:MAG TPA: glycosyltransferase [Candidatus Acidoferrales bacterium]|nr:glycosyltransferase [Candidatus Acidoferrales bacterium]